MIKMTLGELVIAEQEGALVEIAKLDLKIKDAIKLTNVLKKVTEELSVFRQVRDEKIKKYGVQKDGNIIIEPNSEHLDTFLAEIKEVQNNILEFDFDPFEYEVIGDESKISAKTLLLLNFLFV